ncbi:Gfo/Idh/MocA family protein [Arenibacterium sp. LLYu02]|uniref:Gfo/Idh/MocA family protein n=1 Tax=Arenibacterium sp. LLYu02 TaxID=3404132 RepID=UPI003B210478
MTQHLKLGIIGCGEATQLLHLPALAVLPDLFEVRALCDISRTVVDGVAASLPGVFATTEPDELLACEDLDAVLVANPSVLHGDTALAAIQAGKHVLIEKPIAFTEAEADRLAAAQQAAGVTVQIGYMRRQAPAFRQAKAEIAALSDISLARVHAVIGPNTAFTKDTARVIRGTDLPQSALDALAARQAELRAEVPGCEDPAKAAIYDLLLNLSSHDLSAMRELIGVPKGVLYAKRGANPLVLSAALDYGDFVCQFETAIDRIARFDSHIEVYAPEKVVRVQYDTPYIRNLKTTLHLTEAEGEFGVRTSVSHSTPRDSFTLQWEQFHHNVTTGTTPTADIADARTDFALFRQIMAALA